MSTITSRPASWNRAIAASSCRPRSSMILPEIRSMITLGATHRRHVFQADLGHVPRLGRGDIVAEMLAGVAARRKAEPLADVRAGRQPVGTAAGHGAEQFSGERRGDDQAAGGSGRYSQKAASVERRAIVHHQVLFHARRPFRQMGDDRIAPHVRRQPNCGHRTSVASIPAESQGFSNSIGAP